jgi:4-amino-4-deoxy-L-arabinose transferase-like glycosyltransferase
LLAWGLSSVVFFSFVRQLHIGYVIPSVAPFALLLADVVSGDSRSEFFRSEKWMVLVRRITLGALLLAAGAVAWDLGHVCGGHPFHIPPIFMIVLVLLGLGLLLKQKPSWSTTPSMSLGVLATALCALYLSAMLVATPYMNRSGSTETIIKVMLANIPGDEVEIGVITRNTFSHYWVALAAERELSKPLKITFLDQSDVGALKDVLVKRKDFEKLPAGVLKDYHERFSYGPWVWLHKGSQGVSEPALNVESSS